MGSCRNAIRMCDVLLAVGDYQESLRNEGHNFYLRIAEYSWSSFDDICSECVVGGFKFDCFKILFLRLNFQQMIIGRFLIGIASGAYCFIVPVYVGEIAVKEIRGILLTGFVVFLQLGILFVYIVGSLMNPKAFNIVYGVLVMLFTVSFTILPETPVFLARVGEIMQAKRSLRMLRGSTYNLKQELADLQELSKEASTKSFIAVLKKRETFKAFVIILCVFFFFQMSGINAIIFYTTTIFIKAGIKMDPSLATIIIGTVQILTSASTTAFVDRFGRVFLLIISFALMIAGLSGIGTFFCLRNIDNFDDIWWLPLPSLCIFIIGFSSGMGPVSFILMGEIFSNEAKKMIAPFAQTMNFVMSSVIAILFPASVSAIGLGLTFFVFAGFCFAGLLFTIFVIPETKGKSLAEIQILLRT